MKTTTRNSIPCLLLVSLVFGCFVLVSAPNAFGVTPAPDGGYPGSNTAEGTNALFSRTTGVWNTALGFQALYHDTSGSSNTATGLKALFSNTIGTQNTANGVYALANNTNADFNTATGYQALVSNQTGDNNTAVGFQALSSTTSGSFNMALGANAGTADGIGSNNIYISDTGFFGDNNVIAIGGISATGTNYAKCFIGGISGTTVTNAVAVLVKSDGQLGVASSSRRFKDDIKPMDRASESILALQPVTFRYKKEIDAGGAPQFGLVAEEVAKVNPDLVIYRDGQPFTVRYDQVNAMLLNEFLKEHKKVEGQQATITELKSTVAQQHKGMEVLTAQFKEQAAQIQKVSAQLEMKKPAPKVVRNSP